MRVILRSCDGEGATESVTTSRRYFVETKSASSNSLFTSFPQRVPAIEQWRARMAEGNGRSNPTFLRGLARLKSSRPVLCHVTSGKEARKNHSPPLTTKRVSRNGSLRSENEWKAMKN